MVKPPPFVVLAYRLLGWRVGPAYQEWVHDDITGPGWLLRQGTPALAALFGLGLMITGLVGGNPDRLVSLVIVLAGAGAFLRNSLRDRALRQQGIDASGNPIAAWFSDESARRQRNVIAAVSTVVLVVAGLWILALRSR